MDKNINHIIIRNIVVSVLVFAGFTISGLLWIWGVSKIWPWISNAPTSILIVREVICVIILAITAAVALAIYSNRYKIAKTGEGHQTAYWAVFVTKHRRESPPF